MKRFATGAALALAGLAGCGGGAPADQANRQISVAAPNPFQAKLLGLSETDRMLALRRGIQDDDESCPRVKSSRYQQTFKGMAMWIAYCSNTSWAVFVDAQGNVQARPCGHAKELGIPECAAAPADPNAPLWPPGAKPVPPAGTR